MDYKHLGRTGLLVSPLCLGTMNFGPETTEPDSHAIMDSAHELGINFFDTANRYGGSLGFGATESIIGRWFAQGGGRREKTVLATKLYGEMDPWPNGGKLSALNIRKAADASLKRLQTDYIDLYQMHHVDRDTPWDEIWEAMTVLRQQGKILYVGSSNFAGWHIAQAQEAAKNRHFLGLVSEQSDIQPGLALGRVRRSPRCRALRPGCHPVVAASGWSARRHHRQAEGRHRVTWQRWPIRGGARREPPADRGVREVLRRTRRGARERRPRTGSCTSRR